jgi:hypothetical protein
MWFYQNPSLLSSSSSSSSPSSSLAQQPNKGQGLLTSDVSRSHTMTHTESVRLPWTCDGPVAETLWIVKHEIQSKIITKFDTKFFHFIITNSVEHSPSSNANSYSKNLPKFHYDMHNSPPPVPVFSHTNPVHATSHYLNIHFNIILPCTTGSSKRSPSFRFPHHNPVCTNYLSHTCYTPRPSHCSCSLIIEQS